ncbi:MAG: hypothetical protein LUE08_00660, partial [Akkermansiaceae bacterium]|nr:hypothetical protein [Akkermansiaceae bacterium]
MKLKLFTAALALGLAASASADTTTRVSYDESSQTVTTEADTSVTSEVTATEAGILSNANPTDNGSSAYWVENTVAFTLDLDALQSYVNSGETSTLTLVSITTSNSHTVGVYMTSDGTIGLLNGTSTWGSRTTTLNDLVSNGLTTLVVMTEMSSETTNNGANKPATYLYGVDAAGNVATISTTTGLGWSSSTAAYVSSVRVDSGYVTSFSVTNATLTADSDGVGAAAVALAAVPEPATATLG